MGVCRERLKASSVEGHLMLGLARGVRLDDRQRRHEDRGGAAVIGLRGVYIGASRLLPWVHSRVRLTCLRTRDSSQPFRGGLVLDPARKERT